MSWWAILALAAFAYACKAAGFFSISRRPLSAPALAIIALIPPALLAAIVVVQSIGDGGPRVLATRAAGVAAGSLVAWRRGPLIVVLVVAAGVTALLRAASG